MEKFKLCIDRFQDDIWVVINFSDTDVPCNTTFGYAQIEQSAQDGGSPENKEIGQNFVTKLEQIELTMKSVEIFRAKLDHLPKGHSGAVTFDGNGLDVLFNFLKTTKRDQRVVLYS